MTTKRGLARGALWWQWALEDNLDNEPVFRRLIPVLWDAKKRRQVIMLTCNRNLTVVFDAKQIIRAKFDRASEPTNDYDSRAIEDTGLNHAAVSVLEGTKLIFENRSGKYR